MLVNFWSNDSVEQGGTQTGTNVKVIRKLAGPIKKILRRLNWLFLLTVLVPTTLATLYYGIIASDVYISESHFVVRSPQRPSSASSFGHLLQTAGFSHAQDDAAAVNDFLTSRDALHELDKQLSLSKSFSNTGIDRISRFGGLDFDLSFENLFKYFNNKIITVTLENSSSIITLRISAFSPEEAYRINTMLLEMSEDLVNQLSKRAKQDMIQFALAEVSLAESKAKEASVALSQYRTRNAIFDPKTQSGMQLQGVLRLREEMINAKTQLAQIQSASEHNPAIPVLQQRIKALGAEIDAETARVTGSQESFSLNSPEYERLELDREFAGKQLTTALATLEQARNEAMRKQLYLDRIAQPLKPDIAIEPRRLRSIVTALVIGLLSWGALSILLAGVREHHD